jgi:hypothetical protein
MSAAREAERDREVGQLVRAVREAEKALDTARDRLGSAEERLSRALRRHEHESREEAGVAPSFTKYSAPLE